MLKRKKFDKTNCREVNEETKDYTIEPSNINIMNKLCRLEMLYFQMMNGIDNLNNELEFINKQIADVERITHTNPDVLCGKPRCRKSEEDEAFNSYFS